MLKEEVLSLLLNAREPVSGEGICKTFGVTRAAVWKTIDQLRQEGYGIDAAPKRGYTLAFVPERLDTALVRAHLSGHPWQALTTAVPAWILRTTPASASPPRERRTARPS